ncbi:SH3 domain-containing protein (plasmid) [Streptomyces sp. NBC_01724]|uniref:SH3 domain-containing protein n=1 Tax=unclassified Streptomyces TaxID=2593676 RepID=UPI002E30B771|nr:SH3 domain-containing protein [Streptomyces sp. NBC_01724]
MRSLIRTAATTAAATTLLLGATAVLATPAAAVGSSACTKNVTNYTAWAATTVNLRSGPGTGYTSLGLLQTDTKVTVSCWKSDSWAYLTVKSGANSGKTGWVSLAYLAVNIDLS